MTLYSNYKSLSGIAFNLINIDDTRIYKDSNKVKIIQELRKHVAILKPDKGNGIVLFDIKDYTNSIEHLFKDPKNTNEIVTKLSKNTITEK